MSRPSQKRGFTLIELLMVVALILIIMGLALPNLLQSRLSATEASAVSTLRVLSSAENVYASMYNSFSPDFDSLGPPVAGAPPSATSADVVDVVLSGRAMNQTSQFTKGGYIFK